MELSKEQEERIVLQVIEKILNLMPEVIGNLMKQHSVNDRVKNDFYTAHPEFKNHTDVVGSVVESEEGKELGQDLETLLNRSVPKIREQIKFKSELNLTDRPTKQSLNLSIDPDDSFGVL